MWNEKTFTNFVSISNLQISKGGDFLVYSTTKPIYQSNNYRRTIVIKDLRTGSEKFIENSFYPRLSKDCKKLAFIKRKTKKKVSEIWILELESFTKRKLIEIKNFLDLIWLKNDKEILIVNFERFEDKDLYFENRIPFWFDERGILSLEKVKFNIYDLESGSEIDSFIQDFFALPYIPVAVAHKNGFVINQPKRENPYIYYDLYQYNEGSLENLMKDVSFIAIDSNDDFLLLHGKPKKRFTPEHDYLYKYKDNNVEPITEKLGYNNYNGKIVANGDVYFSYAFKGKVLIEKIGREKEVLVDQEGYILEFDVSENDKVAFVMQTTTSPDEVFIFDKAIMKVTNYNSKIIEKLDPIRPIKFEYKSFDGKTIDAWYFKPKKENSNLPLIVMVHGGPKGMYGYQFNFQAQLFANNGFVVLLTNPRGSDGYSEDFALEVMQRTGLEDFKDITFGVEELLKREVNIDRGKIGITGISYGGFMTNWAIGNSDLFKAAVSENGISYWISDYGFSDIGYWFNKDLIGIDPLSNENYKKLSPLMYAKNVNTPVLFIHSVEDYRCTFDQSLIFYTILKDLGKEAYLVLFKKGFHAHSINGSPRHRAKRYKILLEYFKQKLIEEKREFDINFLKNFD